MDHNTATEDMIFVEAGVNANIILAGVNINVGTTWNDYDDCPLRIADNSTGDVTITIQDGTTNTLTSYGSCAGIQKTGDANTGTLTIRGDGKDSGVLNATGGEYGAGAILSRLCIRADGRFTTGLYCDLQPRKRLWKI